MRALRHYIEKQEVKNQIGRANTDEQPSAGVLQALAAAGGLPDWFKFNPDRKTVKL
jgi:hypothetical protein